LSLLVNASNCQYVGCKWKMDPPGQISSHSPSRNPETSPQTTTALNWRRYGHYLKRESRPRDHMSERSGGVVDEMFAGIEGIFEGSWDSPENTMLRQGVPNVRNLHEEESAGTQNPSDLRKQWARISNMLKHVDERDNIKRTARKTCLLQGTDLDIQCELFTREASADRTRLHSRGAPTSLSCSA
jgi:hypothetical protein